MAICGGVSPDPTMGRSNVAKLGIGGKKNLGFGGWPGTEGDGGREGGREREKDRGLHHGDAERTEAGEERQ